MEPAAMNEQSASAADWVAWIEWPGGECPIPHLKAGEYEMKSIPGGKGCSDEWAAYMSSRTSAGERGIAGCWAHAANCWPVVAYRVRQAKPVVPDLGAAMRGEKLAAMQDDLAEAQRRFGVDRMNSAGHAIGALAGQEWTGDTIAAAVSHLEMLERDGSGPTAAPILLQSDDYVPGQRGWCVRTDGRAFFYGRNVTPAQAPTGLTSCASMTHKLGGWGVQS